MNMKNPAHDPLAFRQTLGHFASGVTIITTVSQGIVHGMTANAFCSISLSPPLVLVSVRNQSRMQSLLTQSERYGVSVLTRSQEQLSQHFSRSSGASLQVPFTWYQGHPFIEGSLAHLLCRVVHRYPAGDHTLYLGQVESLGHADNGAPLLFYGGKYQSLEMEVQALTHASLYEPSWW